MKIVIDTNVILSSLLSSKGASNRLLVWLFENRSKLNVVSNTLITEMEDVLTREANLKKYNNLTKKDVVAFVDDICLISHHQKINFLWRPFLRDADDDMVLEVAVNSGAGAIITFNPKDFKAVKEGFGIDILTPKQYLVQIGVMI